MLKLIRLELQRTKLTNYLIAASCILLSTIAFSFLFAFMPAIAKSHGDILPPTELAMFSGWTNLITMLSTISMVFFAFLGAIMYAHFVVAEYTGKRAILLFSYPVKRSRILWAKCNLVFWFTASAMLLSNVVAITLFGLSSNLLHIIDEPFTSTLFIYLLTTSLILCLLSSAISLIALRIGFWKKSITLTLVSVLILANPCSNLFAATLGNSTFIMLATMVFLLMISFILFLSLTKSVNHMEVL